jgi:hypothetical protein
MHDEEPFKVVGVLNGPTPIGFIWPPGRLLLI